jgi:hypothetical protein
MKTDVFPYTGGFVAKGEGVLPDEGVFQGPRMATREFIARKGGTPIEGACRSVDEDLVRDGEAIIGAEEPAAGVLLVIAGLETSSGQPSPALLQRLAADGLVIIRAGGEYSITDLGQRAVSQLL